MDIYLEDLIGTHILSGVEFDSMQTEEYFGVELINYVKFTLDDITYLAIEDPADGYRSYCEKLKISSGGCKIKLPNIPVNCIMKQSYSDDVLIFQDRNNDKVILEVGTENTDDYYPYCVFRYYPENISLNAQ
jgi:hypothetical protein